MRFADALLPMLELATEQCRKLAAEPEPAAPVPQEPAKATEPEAEKLPALGESVVQIEVDALRLEERAALRFIQNHGPLTMTKFFREYKGLDPSGRDRVLEDLHRFGLIARYVNGRGWTVIHATDKVAPLFTYEADAAWPKRPRGAKPGPINR